MFLVCFVRTLVRLGSATGLLSTSSDSTAPAMTLWSNLECQRDHLFARFGICIRYIGACQSELSTDFSTGEGTVVCEGLESLLRTHRSWCASVVFDQAFEPIDGRRDAVLTRQPVGDLLCGRRQRDSLSQSFGEGCAAQPAKGCGSDPHCV